MSNINYLIDCIKREIPQELLEYTFQPEYRLGTIPTSMDYMIRSEVIEGWLLRDCNLLGGTEVTIPLAGATLRTTDHGSILQIPMSATGNKLITSVLSISQATTAYSTNSNSMSNVHAPGMQTISARLQLTGPNTIYVEGTIPVTQMYLRCVLANDKDFSNIPARAMTLLADLGVLACKSYIYTNRIIRVESAAIVSGVSIGKYADIIDGYSDSIEIYKEMRSIKWRKSLILQDPTSRNRYLRSLIPR